MTKMNVSIDWMFRFVDDATSTAGEQLVYEVVVVGEPKPKVTWLYNHKHISVSHFSLLIIQILYQTWW